LEVFLQSGAATILVSILPSYKDGFISANFTAKLSPVPFYA